MSADAPPIPFHTHVQQVWNANTRQCLLSMSNHQLMVTCVKWGGEGLIYSASRDCSISAWDATDGKLVSVPHLFHTCPHYLYLSQTGREGLQHLGGRI